MGLGNALELAQQEVIQALAARLCVHRDKAGRRGWAWFALYNVFHLRTLNVSG